MKGQLRGDPSGVGEGPVACKRPPPVGMAVGAEVDFISFLVRRYFSEVLYGRVYGIAFALFVVGSGSGPLTLGACSDHLDAEGRSGATERRTRGLTPLVFAGGRLRAVLGDGPARAEGHGRPRRSHQARFKRLGSSPGTTRPSASRPSRARPDRSPPPAPGWPRSAYSPWHRPRCLY